LSASEARSYDVVDRSSGMLTRKASCSRRRASAESWITRRKVCRSSAQSTVDRRQVTVAARGEK
jgi:hypothetical protein